MVMRTSCRALSLGVAIASVGVCKCNTIARGNELLRRLEDVNSNSYSVQSVQFGGCGRLKQQEDNDNDDADGLSYFYNGRYHSQYTPYASFQLCESGCGSCDGYTYVTDLYDFVEMNVEYVAEYCSSCSQQCQRRMEEDNQDEDQGDDNYNNYNANSGVDCSMCNKQCSSLGGGALTDEVNYLDCQQAYVDQNEGIQIYSGLTCHEGSIIIGTFYDDECTVKHSSETYGDFSYDTFLAVESFCYSSDYAYSGAIYPDVMTCSGSSVVDDGGRDDAKKLCRLFKEDQLTKFHRKTDWHLGLIFSIIFAMTFCFTCGSYVYYIRHREKPLSDPFAKMDHDVTESADKGEQSDSTEKTGVLA